MTAHTPPTARCDRAAGSAASSWPSSSLTSMRRAWKTRRAGCPFRRAGAGTADATTSASCLVEVSGRASTTARAMRPDRRPSPFSRNSAARSSTGRVLTRSAAVGPDVGSIRMSSGPSSRNEKPRSDQSSCGELTPRSRSTPARGPNPGLERTDSSVENGAAMSVTRSPKADSRSRAASRAAGSRSSPTMTQVGVRLEQRRGVTAPADGRVDDHPGGHGCEQRDHFVAQHGNVFERMGHLQPPGRWVE